MCWRTDYDNEIQECITQFKNKSIQDSDKSDCNIRDIGAEQGNQRQTGSIGKKGAKIDCWGQEGEWQMGKEKK